MINHKVQGIVSTILSIFFYSDQDHFQGKTFGIFDAWASFIFIGAAQRKLVFTSSKSSLVINTVVMILRVWALYRRSVIILATLLTLYAIEFILYFVAAVIASITIDRTGM